MKIWINKALNLLNQSLGNIPQELNELDWKESLTANIDKFNRHLSAFANYPGGGFLVFGVNDKTGQVIGVNAEDVKKILTKVGEYARNNVEPPVLIDHSIKTFKEKDILIIFIQESATKPVHIAHKSIEECYIRSSCSTRKASRQELGGLMLNSKLPVYEELHATKLKTALEVITALDFASIFKMLKRPIPQEIHEITLWMQEEKMLSQIESDGFYITNFGALSAANNLNDFDGLARKAVRIIKYEGKTKVGQSKEYPAPKGYGIGFETLIQLVKSVLPGSEIVKNALRQDTAVYPEIALRELIANILIHQDFSIRGSGPMIEIFSDRVEFSNPGKLLPNKNIDRLVRTTPESRNELLASAFRRYNICEERGSGFEKALTAIELFGLPPLKFQEIDNTFKVTIYAPKSFAEMTEKERVEACYQHSVIQFYGSTSLTNASLRQRFKMQDKQRSQISRLIKTTVELGRIKLKDEANISDKFAGYIPYWA